MRILLFNQDWFAAELQELGHQVITCGHEHHLDHQIPCRTNTLQDVLRGLGSFSPDVIVWHDNSMPTLLLAGLESCQIPVVLYSVDTHHHHSIHSYIASIFDHILVAQRDYLPLFAETGTPTSWLPLWAPRFVEPSDAKQWGATFVGNLNPLLNPRRVAFFEELAKKTPIHIAHGNYWEIFPHAEIVVNQTVKGDLNFRVFEAMMSGALLLTERTPNGLLDLFTDGEHLVTYAPDNSDEAAAKIGELLAAPSRAREIALRGRAEILKNHTAMQRALKLESLLKRVTKRVSAQDRHFVAMVNHSTTSQIKRKTSSYPCAYALTAAVAAAREGIRQGEGLSDLQAGHLIRACLSYDRLTGTTQGVETLTMSTTKGPQHPMVSLATIRNLLNRGQRDEALGLAMQWSDSEPERVFLLAEELVQQILSTGE